MKYYAKVIETNDNVDEEVLLSFGEVDVYCFIASCPYEITKGNVYLVDVELSFLDDEVIEPQLGNNSSLIRRGDGFSYEIRGFKIEDKIIVNGLAFSDELYAKEYGYINNEYVITRPDRISVSFI